MKTTLENGTLVLGLEGRIDTNNAAETEQKIFSVVEEQKNDTEKVQMDAGKLEYISSAGLRVLMKLRKSLGYPLEVVNVSRDVYDIFETTGFTELLQGKSVSRYFHSVRSILFPSLFSYSCIYLTYSLKYIHPTRTI